MGKTSRQRKRRAPKNEMVFVRATAPWKTRLEAVADVLDQDVSRIVRDAVDAHLERLCSQNKTVARAVKAAAAA